MARNSFKKLLKERFAEANRLAIGWLFEDLRLVDTGKRKTLFDENTVKVALYIGIKKAHGAGLVPKLNVVEKDLVRSICKIPKKSKNPKATKMLDSITKIL